MRPAGYRPGPARASRPTARMLQAAL